MRVRPPAGCLLAGASAVDITPPSGVPYLAFIRDGRHQPFQAVHDPLFAKAIVADDGERRIALVVADAIGFAGGILGEGRHFAREVRAGIERRCGIPPERVMLTATHAHSTPETIGFRPLRDHPGATEWLEALVDHLADAVATAGANLQPVRLKTIRGPIEGMAAARRLVGRDGRARMRWSNPAAGEIVGWGVTDPEATILCFESIEGKPEIVLVHFACHPVAVQAQPLVSADFPGAAAARIEAAGIGCRHCLYLQGAAGNIDPVRCTGGFEDVAHDGELVANEALRLIGRASESSSASNACVVDAAREMVQLPPRPLPSLEALECQSKDWQRRSEDAASDAEREEARFHWLELAEQLECVRTSQRSYSAEVQVLRMGDVALAGVPGEPFVEFGLALKRSGLAPITLCLGYANDYLGYFAPASAWEQGGYEVSLGRWSVVGPEAVPILARTSEALVARLCRKA